MRKKSLSRGPYRPLVIPVLMAEKYKNSFIRLIKIDELLRKHRTGGISVRDIAKETGISCRTIQRDLLYLQTEFDAPIFEENHRYFYNYKWSLLDIVYTKEDMSVLALARGILGSLFVGTTFGQILSDRLQNFLEHCANMKLIQQDFCREEIQIAFPKNICWVGAEQFLEALLNKKSVFVYSKENDKNCTVPILIKPIRIIFAWDSCYMLYFTADYKDNRDFKIEFPKNLEFIREATKSESQKIPDILNDGISFAGLNTSWSRVFCDDKGNDCLEIKFEGRLDPFILQYRRNTDGSLSFIENTVSVNSGHLYDLLGEEC